MFWAIVGSKAFRITVVITAILAALGWVYWAGHTQGKREVLLAWSQEREARAAAHAQELEKARQREAELQKAADDLRRKRAKELQAINADFQRVIDGLRNRPEARAGAGGVPEAPGAGVGCTGEGLARRDAEFLGRYAADAARLQSALSECRARYQAASEHLGQ